MFGLKETSETHPLGKPVPKVVGLYVFDFLKQILHKKKIYKKKYLMSSPCISYIHLRHYSFFDQVIYRTQESKGFMGSLCVVENQIIGKFLVR